MLQCHPTEKRLVMTAGYDGKINVWDIERGCLQQSYAPSLIYPTRPCLLSRRESPFGSLSERVKRRLRVECG